MIFRNVYLLVFVTVLGGQCYGQSTSVESPSTIVIDVCVVSSINDVNVSARVKGYLQSQEVEEGQFVEQQALVSQLDTTAVNNELLAAEIRLENARRQADDQTGLLYAQATHAVAKQELEINRDLNRKNALSDQELRRSELSERQADLQVQRSESQLLIDQGTVRLEEQNVVATKELVDRHNVMAPFAGQVIKIFRRPGEWVHEGEKILRLVDLSQVKVEGHVSLDVAAPDELMGRTVTVTLEMLQGQAVSFTGEIRNIGLEQKPGGLLVVQAIVDNEKRNGQWLLRPNAVVAMTIQPSS